VADKLRPDDEEGLIEASRTDVRSSGEVEQWVGESFERHGHVDILICAAGVMRDAKIERMTDEEFEEVLAVSVRGTFNCVRAVLPIMRSAGWGRIVTFASASWRGNAGQANYSAAKAAVVGFTRTVCLEAAADGVTANIVSPGPINAGMLRSLKPHVRDQLLSRVPAARLGSAEDISSAVSFLASEEAGFINGVILDVDGGMSTSSSLR
jgi:3-oxoacyl-[acyl-carrier protein] reductase